MATAAEQIALEIVAEIRGNAGAVLHLIDPSPEIICVPLAFAIDGLFRHPLSSRFRDEQGGGALQFVVNDLSHESPAVPSANLFAHDIVEHPTFASVHAVLVNACAEHVVVVAHHYAVECVGHGTLVAFDVEFDPGVELLWFAISVKTVVCHGQECSPE